MEEKLSTIGKLNSSLLNLRFLNYLDLSGINFKHGGIPIFLGSMKQLRYLNLSFGNFYGTVPRQLGNLTELEVLDLHDDHGDLFVDDTHWVSYLRSLNYLDMSGLNFTDHGDLMQVINMLPSLSHLSLSACGLCNFHLSSIRLANSTSLVHLQYLDLSTNFLEGPITNDVFQNMTSLQHLDLSRNSFNSSIPMWFGKLTSLVLLNLEGNFFLSIEGGLFSFLKSKKYLKSLNLCGNQIREETLTSHGNSSRFIENNLESLVMCNNYLSDALPNWLVSFTLLRYLDLHSNFFSGPILGVIGELPNLVTIDLSHNQLNETIPSSLGQLSSLRSLNLSYNRLFGHIPKSLGQLQALQDLHLDNNHLNGTIPSNLGELSHLLALYLSDNALGGVISEIHFANLSRLKYLDIGNNYKLTFKAELGWRPPFQLRSIRMNSCKFRTTFPHWMQTQVEVSDVYLSNASIFGALPKWLGNMTFSHFDLSYNQITGTLPNVFFNYSNLDLSHNLISGSLPANIGEMCIKTLYLNDNLINGPIPSSLCDMLDLTDLDLSNNKLSGSIPNCWKGSRLSHLILSFNKLSGVIPSSIGSLSDLYILRLNGNHFNGELPLALGYCTSLVILDLGGNNFSGSIPTWFNDSFWVLLILRLRENSFSGSIPPQLCALPGLQILDMAMNNLTGMIPHCLGYMNGMKTFNQDSLARFLARFEDLNKEHVVEIMKGRYNEYTKIVLDLVVNLDLSSNNLIGSNP